MVALIKFLNRMYLTVNHRFVFLLLSRAHCLLPNSDAISASVYALWWTQFNQIYSKRLNEEEFTQWIEEECIRMYKWNTIVNMTVICVDMYFWLCLSNICILPFHFVGSYLQPYFMAFVASKAQEPSCCGLENDNNNTQNRLQSNNSNNNSTKKGP